MLEAGQAPLAAAVGAEVGATTVAWYAAAGVDLRLGQGVDEVRPGGLALAGGEWLAADVVVTAIGVRPAVAWLDGSAIRLENGVAVDGQLRTSVPGVFAVGDCAAFRSARYGRRLRFEHWDVALHAPEVAAANIARRQRGLRPGALLLVRAVRADGAVRRLPRGGRTAWLWRGDPGRAGTWAAAWLAGDRLVALLTVGLPRDLLQGRRVIEAGAPVDAARLADPPFRCGMRPRPEQAPRGQSIITGVLPGR